METSISKSKRGPKRLNVKTPQPENVFNIDYQSKEFNLAKAHLSDSGFDIQACVSSDVTIGPGEFKSIDTGVRMDIPAGLEIQVRPRSGLAMKHGVTVLNSPGTIDSGYRGEIKVILINHGKEDFIIKNGDRIAQLVVAKVLDVEMIKVKEINLDTDRKEKGFSSTETQEKK